jgi:fibronectin-binding autotransporter adhesin
VAAPGFFTNGTVSGIATAPGSNVMLANVGGATGGGAIVLDSDISSLSGSIVLRASGNISQTGGTISANSLTGSSGGGVSLVSKNPIATLTGFSVNGSGDFTLQTAGDLALGGNVVAPDGSISIATTGKLTLPSDLMFTATNHIALGGQSVLLTGTFLVQMAPTVIIDVTGLSAAELNAITLQLATEVGALPTGTGAQLAQPLISFGSDFNAQTAQVLVSVNDALVSGTVWARGFGITGLNDTVDLSGAIDGITTMAAAQIGVRAQGADNAVRFNGCAIGSPSCIALPVFIPVLPPSVNSVELLPLAPPGDPLDIDRVNTENEDDL